jgi:glycosyltransferase involved in cell wall biosynthesis
VTTGNPKLLYLGDVPVESTLFGAALLYRLLANYAADDLVILEASPWNSRPAGRLPGIHYRTFPLGSARLLNSRLRRLYGSWLLARVRAKWKCIDSLVQPFSPQAVVTVTHGYTWLAAAEYAVQKRLPLHLILHDDWPGQNLILNRLEQRAERLLCDCYRAAASRLCISPGMAAVYQNEFLAPAGVLYPCSASTARKHDEPPEALFRDVAHPVVGFGGTVSEGQAGVLRIVAEALFSCGGKLVMYGPITPRQARAVGLDLPNIELLGFVNSGEMLCAFREMADLLLIPQSFLESDRRQCVMSFPSKIADYTAVGRPLLIVAPQYSSLVEWCARHHGLAEIVTEQDSVKVQSAIKRLVSNPNERRRLALRALEVHREFFSHAKAWAVFSNVLCGRSRSGLVKAVDASCAESAFAARE